MVKFPTPGTRLPIKCSTIHDGLEIEKNALIPRFFVLHEIELPCDNSLLFFILKTFLNATVKICIKQDKSLYYLVSSEKCFDLHVCRASSLWEL